MDENQWGFREGRSTADVTQVIVRMKEDADDYANNKRSNMRALYSKKKKINNNNNNKIII